VRLLLAKAVASARRYYDSDTETLLGVRRPVLVIALAAAFALLAAYGSTR
jgi:hypothetical protein